MTKRFVRFFWGVDDNPTGDRVIARKKRVQGNISILLSNKYNHEFTTYVWGEDNYNMLKEFGITDIKLVYKEPFQWDLESMQYRHKLEGLRLAMQDWDEIVHEDWDCLPTKALPNNFWDILSSKEKFQANIYQYRAPKCYWRKTDQRKLCNGGFVYFRDKNTVEEMISVWASDRNKNKRSCEPTMSMWLDDYTNGWIGSEKYYELFEPTVCRLYRNSPYVDDGSSVICHWAGCGKIKNIYKEV